MRPLERWLRQCFQSIRVTDAERKMDEEMRFHLEMETADLRSAGFSDDEARRKALAAFGGVERFKQEARDERRFSFVEHFARDTRLAVRQLRRSRGIALFSSALLAIGIGGMVVVFSVINTLYFRALPYPDANRLVRVQTVLSDTTCGMRCGRSPNAREVDVIARQATSIEALGTIRISSSTFRSPDGAMLLEGALVSQGLVSLLGLQPMLGRSFIAADFASDASAVVVLSRSEWQRDFNSDSAVIGRAVTLNDVAYVVIGVMNAEAELGPPLFTFNARRAQYLIPDRADRIDVTYPTVIARVRNVNALPAVRAELDRLISGVTTESLISGARDRRSSVTPIREIFIERYRASFWNLLGAAAAVLLITGLNVFGLYAARLHDRSQELATRVALGASRYRIAQQIAIETFVIAGVGGIGGLVIGIAGTSLLNLLPVDSLPFWTRLQVDIRGVALATVLTCIIGLVLGAAALAILAPQQMLKSWRVGAAGGKNAGRVRQVLVASQIAVTVTLLGVAGLLGKIVLQAELRDIGTARHGMMYVLLESPSSTNVDASLALNRRLTDRLMRIPGVTAVGMLGASSAMMPNTKPRDRRAEATAAIELPVIAVEGDESTALRSANRPSAASVSTQYFEAMGTTVLQGRAFNETDHLGAPAVVIVDQPTAARLVHSGSIVGKRIGIALTPGDRVWMTVVGVVSPVVANPLEKDARFSPQIYRPLSQVPSNPSSVSLSVSTATYPTGNAIRAAIQDVDPSIATARILSVEESIGLRVATARLSAALLVGSAIFATALCCLGIYAAITFVVTSRQREIAIRLALGAAHGEVVQLFMFAATRMVCTGLLLGLIGAIASTRFIKSMLYGASNTSPAVLAIALSFMLISGVVAAWIPSRRATRLEPARLLRSA